MKTSYWFLFFLLACSLLSAQQRIDSNFAFQTDPAKKYSIYVPSTYSAASANKMMLGLHPFNTSRWDAESWCDTLIDFAEMNGLLLICPDGGADGRVDDAIDTAFATAVMDSMEVWYNVDTDNIYAMGFSVGGRATHTYGLNHTSRMSGWIPIGAAISGLNEVTPNLLKNADCIPVYLVHGSNDSPNNRYWPVRQALIDSGAVVESILMSGVGHTIDFPNRNQILTTAYQFIDSVNNAPLHVDAGLDHTICVGGGRTLGSVATGSGGECPYTYAWTPSLGLNSATVARPFASPTATTTYVLTVTDGEGTSLSDSVVITVNPTPTASVGMAFDTLCQGDTVSLSASGGTSYSWSPSFGLTCVGCANPDASPFFSQTYTVTVTDQNGCVDQAAVQVEVLTLPVANAGPDVTLCEGDTFQLSASGGGVYEWTPATGLSDAMIADPTGIADSTLQYSVLVRDANGCADEDQVQVMVDPKPTADFQFSGSAQAFQFTDNSQGNLLTWTWDFGDGSTATQQNPQHTYASLGTYTVCLTVETTAGCIDSTCSTVEALTGRTALSELAGIKAFAAATRVHLRLSPEVNSEVEVALLDLTGKQVAARRWNPSELAPELIWEPGLGMPGVYLLVVSQGENRVAKRIVLED